MLSEDSKEMRTGSICQASDPEKSVHNFRTIRRSIIKRNHFPLSQSQLKIVTYHRERSTTCNSWMSQASKMSCPSSTAINTNRNLRIRCDSKQSTLIRCAIRVVASSMPLSNSYMLHSTCLHWPHHPLIVIVTVYSMMILESAKHEVTRWDQHSSLPISDSAVRKLTRSMVMEMQMVMWVADKTEADIHPCKSKDVIRTQIITVACPRHLKFNTVKTITRHMYVLK